MKKLNIGTFFVRLMMILWSLVIIVPFAMLFLTATKTNEEFYANVWALPRHLASSVAYNFLEAWERGNFGVNFVNTVVIVGGAMFMALTLSAMVSYAITRRHLRCAKVLNSMFMISYLILLGLLIPAMVGLTPMFIMARFMGLFDTRMMMSLTFGARAIPFCVMIMVSFFKTIPHQLEEAAYIDGASPWRTFGQVILPLVRPAFVTAGICLFIDGWSDYMYGLMFISDKAKNTISMGMLSFRVVACVKRDWGGTCAACVIFIAPILVLYAIFQKQIIGGLTAGSVKG